MMPVGPKEIEEFSRRLLRGIRYHLWKLLGHAFGQLAHWELAANCFHLATQEYRATGELRDVAYSLVGEAECLTQLGRPGEALTLYQEGCPLLRADDYALCLINQAICLGQLGRPGEALPLYEKVCSLPLPHRKPTNYASYLMNWAICLDSLDRLDEALSRFQQACSLFQALGSPTQYARCLMNQATCLGHLDQLDEALSLFQQACSLLQVEDAPLESAYCLMNQAACLARLGRRREALQLYQEAADLSQELGPGAAEVCWRAHHNLGAVYSVTDDIPHAREESGKAIAIVENLAGSISRIRDRLSLRATYADAYRCAVVHDLLQNDIASGFAHAQQAKGRFLADLLEYRFRLIPFDPLERRLAELAEQEDALLARPLDPTSRNLVTIREERVALLRRLETERDERALRHGRVQTLARIQQCLRADEALLDFLTLDGGIAAFIVTRTGVDACDPLPDSRLLPLLKRFHDEFAETRDLARVGWTQEVVSLHALHQALIQPLEDRGFLDGIQRLVISPSGPLHAVPFAALCRENGGQVRYLCEDYLLSLIPTATSLWYLRQRKPLNGSITFLGVAPFADSPDVYQTGREVHSVAMLVRTATSSTESAVVRDGPGATRQQLLALLPRARLVVCATHGIPAADVLDFRLLLAPEQANALSDLSIWDVYEGRVPLGQAFQVVLSACHLGDVAQQGEEALGFIQAFLSAGARVVLAPLWAVDGPATAELSIAYHATLLQSVEPGQEQLTAAEAMREAMGQVRSDPRWGHPYFWAAILPAGDAALCLPGVPGGG